MSHQHMLERTRPFTRTSSVDGLPTGVDSPAMSLSDSPGFSTAEESDFSGFASSSGRVPIRHTGFGIPDHLEYLQGTTSMNSSSSSLGISVPGKYSRSPSYDSQASHGHHSFRNASLLTNQLTQLQRENQDLQKEVLILQTQNVTLRSAYDTLVQTVPQALAVTNPFNLALPTATSTSDSPLRQSDFPHVKFWHKRDWTAFQKDSKGLSSLGRRGAERGKVRASQGENVTMLFVEDKDGKSIDGHRAMEIRRIARSIWAELAKKGRAPKSWCKADMSTAQEYNREMRRFFPELGFCEFDWKAEQIAIENYPSWYQHHSKDKEKSVKRESADVILDSDSADEVVPVHVKRSRSDAAPQPTKRKKNSAILNPPIEQNSASSAESAITHTQVASNTTAELAGDRKAASITIRSPLTHLSVTRVQSSALTADPAFPQATLPPTTVASTGMDVDSPALGSMDCTSVGDTDTSEPHLQPLPVIPSNRSDEVNIVDFHMSSSTTPATIPLSKTGDEADTTISLPTAAATSFTQASPSTLSSSSHSPVASSEMDVQSPLQPAGAAPSLPCFSSVVLPWMGAGTEFLSPPLPQLPPAAVAAPPSSLPLPISPRMSVPSLVSAIIGHTTAPVTASSDESTHLPPRVNPQPPTKKSTKMRPGAANTARNICAREWVSLHPRGTTAEFKEYFDQLPAADKKKYDEQAAKMKAAVTAAAAGGGDLEAA